MELSLYCSVLWPHCCFVQKIIYYTPLVEWNFKAKITYDLNLNSTIRNIYICALEFLSDKLFRMITSCFSSVIITKRAIKVYNIRTYVSCCKLCSLVLFEVLLYYYVIDSRQQQNAIYGDSRFRQIGCFLAIWITIPYVKLN